MHRARWAFTILFALPAPVYAAVRVSGSTCVAPSSVETALEQVLENSAAGREIELHVLVNFEDRADSTLIWLRAISRSGDVILKRSFVVGRYECSDVAALLAVVLERRLRALPLAEWTRTIPEAIHPGTDDNPQPIKQPPKPEMHPGPDPVRAERTQKMDELTAAPAVAEATVDLFVRIGISSDWLSLGGSLDANLALAVVGSDERLIATATLRASAPQNLADGKLVTTAAMVGIGWRHEGDPIVITELRGGMLMAAGLGHDLNRAEWAAWAEAYGGVSWDLDGVALGPYVAASPLRHQAQLAGSASSRAISSLRVGLTAELGLGDFL